MCVASKPVPGEILPLIKLCYLNFPKQYCQLGTKFSNAVNYGLHFPLHHHTVGFLKIRGTDKW